MHDACPLHSHLLEILQCPSSGQELQLKGTNLFASDSHFEWIYPIISGIPILIDDEKSLFSIKDYVKQSETIYSFRPRNKFISVLRKLTPAQVWNPVKGIYSMLTSQGFNLKADQNYEVLADLLRENARVLVVGSGFEGKGIQKLTSRRNMLLVNTDVYLGDRVDVVCDAHQLPFKDCQFDCVIVQAVLEHVCDPYQCVTEIHRVLRNDGIVYAETPFMQQVHMYEYDFTRFTHLGHRRLFRFFSEINSGPCCGPGMALQWSYTSFLTSFSENVVIKRLLRLFSYFSSFYLKYFDYFLINSPGSYDAASGYFFIGRKADEPISDKQVILGFRGSRGSNVVYTE